MIIQWKPTSPNSFAAMHGGVNLTLSENGKGEWRFTADGQPVRGWWTTSKNAKEAAEKIARRTLDAARAAAPVARPRPNAKFAQLGPHLVDEGARTGRFTVNIDKGGR